MVDETGQARRREIQVIGLVGGAFGVHHFLQLALPPLFPLLKIEFQISYAALGGIMTAFSLASAAAQIPVGFLVDRVGARWVLMGGLGLASVALALIGATSSYAAFLALALVMGAANSACTPADYAILSTTIARARAGRAFSLHTFAGQVGFVLAPATMGLLAAWGGWRMAVVVAGAVGLSAVAALVWARHLLVEGAPPPTRTKTRQAAGEAEKGGFALLLSLPILLFFLFFILNSSASTGIRTFSVTAMTSFHGSSLTVANAALTGYFVGTSSGVLLGGWLADRVTRYDLPFAAVALPGVAVLALLGGFVLPGVGMIAGGRFLRPYPGRHPALARRHDHAGDAAGLLRQGARLRQYGRPRRQRRHPDLPRLAHRPGRAAMGVLDHRLGDFARRRSDLHRPPARQARPLKANVLTGDGSGL